MQILDIAKSKRRDVIELARRHGQDASRGRAHRCAFILRIVIRRRRQPVFQRRRTRPSTTTSARNSRKALATATLGNASVSGSTSPPGTKIFAPGFVPSAAAECRLKHIAVMGRPASRCAMACAVVPLSKMTASSSPINSDAVRAIAAFASGSSACRTLKGLGVPRRSTRRAPPCVLTSNPSYSNSARSLRIVTAATPVSSARFRMRVSPGRSIARMITLCRLSRSMRPFLSVSLDLESIARDMSSELLEKGVGGLNQSLPRALAKDPLPRNCGHPMVFYRRWYRVSHGGFVPAWL